MGYQGVSIESVDVIVQNSQPNRFQTFWQQSDVDLSRGMYQITFNLNKNNSINLKFYIMFKISTIIVIYKICLSFILIGMDFTPRGNVFARFTHLQHQPFTYRIQVNNSNSAPRMGTVRIFMAPKQDERGLPILLRDQRTLFIELDKFTVSCKYLIFDYNKT